MLSAFKEAHVSSETTTQIPFPKYLWQDFDPISKPSFPSPQEGIPGFVRIETKWNSVSQEFTENGKQKKKRWTEFRSEVFFDTYENAYAFYERVKKCDALKKTISIAPQRALFPFWRFPNGIPPRCSIHPFDIKITNPFDTVWNFLNGKEESPAQVKPPSALILEKMKQKFPPIPGSHEEMKANQSSGEEKSDTSGVDSESSVDIGGPHELWGECTFLP